MSLYSPVAAAAEPAGRDRRATKHFQEMQVSHFMFE